MKWNLVPLGTVCTVSSSKRIFAKEYRTEGIPFYRGKEVIEKHKGNPVSTELFISKERYEEIRCKYDVPQIGDILLTSVGTLGVSWLVDENEFYFKDGNLTWLRAKDGLLNKFLYLWLNSDDAKHQIDMMCIGSTQKALTIETINKFVIPLPSMQEQESICAVIYPIIERIKNNRNINDNLQQQAHALYKEWFVDFAPFGGGMPSTWSKGKLKDILYLKKCPIKAGANSELPYLPIDTIPMRSFAVTDFRPNEEAQSSLITFNRDDIIIGAMRVYFHRVVLAPCDGITRTTCFTLSPLHAEYLAYGLLTCDLDSSIDHAQNTSKGSTMPYAIWDGGMGEIEIPIPPIEIARKFNDLILPMLRQIQRSYYDQLNLRELRDTLLPQLMSGSLPI